MFNLACPCDAPALSATASDQGGKVTRYLVDALTIRLVPCGFHTSPCTQ